MKLAEIKTLLDCEVICGGDQLQQEISECFAADLMSDVLAFGRSDALLITGLTGIQSVHTTHLADLKAILFVHSKRPAQPVLDLAREKGIPVLSTPHQMFDACGILFTNGLRGGGRP